LKNRLPNERVLGKYTSYELFFKRRPRISDLRVWGCDAYQLLPAGQVPGQQNRRRLIYVGHTPDRLGWKCFDPINFKFVIAFELLFDEESAKKRICALREFDARRTLAKEGRLDELPLMANDFDTTDTTTTAALDSERRLYPIPLPPPDVIGSGGAVSDREVEGARDDSAIANGNGATAESGLNGLRAGSATVPTVDDRVPDLDDSSDDEDEGVAHAEGNSEGLRASDDYFRNEHHVDGERLPGPLIRSGGNPTVDRAAGSVGASGSERAAGSVGASGSERATGSVGAIDAPDGISEEDATDLFTRDEDAERYGPLSENQLKNLRLGLRFSPSCPVRPLRVLPTGRQVEDNERHRPIRGRLHHFGQLARSSKVANGAPRQAVPREPKQLGQH
jgi:hypothetical protein